MRESAGALDGHTNAPVHEADAPILQRGVSPTDEICCARTLAAWGRPSSVVSVRMPHGLVCASGCRVHQLTLSRSPSESTRWLLQAHSHGRNLLCENTGGWWLTQCCSIDASAPWTCVSEWLSSAPADSLKLPLTSLPAAGTLPLTRSAVRGHWRLRAYPVLQYRCVGLVDFEAIECTS